MGTELELKYRVPDRAAWARILREAAQNWKKIEMETAYFDTPDRALSARRWTLRLRRENGAPVLCCKTPGGVVEGVAVRGEWEWPGEDLTAGIPALIALGAPAELADLAAAGLQPRCGARFTRRAAQIELPEGTLELAADCGVLTGGDWSLPFRELEAEHKAGSSARTVAYAKNLAEQFGLTPEPQSKLQRALALCERRVSFTPAAPADEQAVCALVRQTIRTVYPRYYPAAAVEACLSASGRAPVSEAIAAGRMRLLRLDGALAAVAVVRGDHITGLYVDPDRAGQGCGGYVMDRLEAELARAYSAARLDAALPALHFFARRGYRTVAHRVLPLSGGAVLVYEEMEKTWKS